MSKPSNLVKYVKESASRATSKVVQDVIRERDNTFSRPSGPIKKKDDIVEELVRMAAAGVGFISEASHYRQEKKKKKRKEEGEGEETIRNAQHPDEALSPEQTNEAIWELDEAVREATPQTLESPPPEEPSDLTKAFLKRHSHHKNVNLDNKLALPAILVQRRPKKRVRGFVRAYAPVLADKGIGQETFLDFIDTFNKALIPSEWLNVINLAGVAGTAAPDPFSMLIGAGAEIATYVAMEMQSRARSNRFLDCINSEFFVPRGLVCLVATWRPSTRDDELIIPADFDREAAESSSLTSGMPKTSDGTASRVKPSEDVLKRARERVHELMKLSNSVLEWAQPAPLVFPAPDDTAALQGQDGKGEKKKKKKKKNALGRTEMWLDEYLDRHAQAKWIEKNGEPSIASLLPKSQFRSRYADPNHPASSGDIVSFFTGGRWQYGHGKPADFKNSDERIDGTKGDKGDEISDPRRPADKPPASEKSGGKKSNSKSSSLLQSDVLYLVILNIPSKEQTTERGEECSPIASV